MPTINGVGTRLLRETEIDKDGTYIATKWFVVGLLPLIPLVSYKILEEFANGNLFINETNYKVIKIPMNPKRLLPILAIVWISILLFSVCLFGVIVIRILYIKLLCLIGIILVITFGIFKLTDQDYVDISSE